jgi:hypothetical protein
MQRADVYGTNSSGMIFTKFEILHMLSKRPLFLVKGFWPHSQSLNLRPKFICLLGKGLIFITRLIGML